MNRLLSRALLTASIVLGASLLLAGNTIAASNSWSWQDLSDKIAERQNHPVWAMARAEPYWYFTDGQDLWTGGHVWRTDGSILTDLTSEIRNTGFSRVDDIVSDGQTVLYLKNVTSKNNIFEVLSYNGNYTNLTYTLRSYFDADEGLVSVHGRDGQWAFVSTKGRVIVGSLSGSFVTALYPGQVNIYYNETSYSMSHDTPATDKNTLPVAIAPVGSSWILAYRDTNTSNNMRVISYTYPSTKVDITEKFGSIMQLQALASNKTTALIAGTPNQYYGSTSAISFYTYDGVTVRNLSTNAASIFPNSSWFNGTLFAWNGTSWMIVHGKNLVRFDGTNFESMNRTRDLILTAAGSLNGRFLVGGVASETSIDYQTNPLTGRMLLATENGFAPITSTVTQGSGFNAANGISYWNWFEPNQTSMNRTQISNFSVGAWSQNGIKRIEIFVNGTSRRTCDFGTAYGNQTCNYTMYGGDYPNYTIATINALITDGNGQTLWTTTQNMAITDGYGTATNNTAGDVATWISLDPSGSVLNRNATVILHVNGSATQGLTRLEVFANDSIVRTCEFNRSYGTQTCDTTIYGSNYASGSQVRLRVRATDYYGRTSWSDTRTLSIQDSGSTSGNSSYSILPMDRDLGTNDQLTFAVGASHPNGIRETRLFVNGAQVRSCTFGNTISWTDCNISIYGGSYSVGSNVTAYGEITDTYGNKTITGTRSYRIVNGGTTTQSGTASSWIWSDPDTMTLASNQAATWAVGAWDPQGIRRIEIWVNGNVLRTCDTGSIQYGNTSCSTTINAIAYQPNTDVFVNAKITNGANGVSWSTSRTYHINSSPTTIPLPSTSIDRAGSIRISSNRETGFRSTDRITFTAIGADANGIDRIEILVNARLVKTCTGASTCTFIGGPYIDRTSVSYGAKVVDKLGYATWSGYRGIMKK